MTIPISPSLDTSDSKILLVTVSDSQQSGRTRKFIIQTSPDGWIAPFQLKTGIDDFLNKVISVEDLSENFCFEIEPWSPAQV